MARPVWLEEGEQRGVLVPNLDPFTASTVRLGVLELDENLGHLRSDFEVWCKTDT